MSAQDCRPGKRHRFDYGSGWCWNNCGNRDDGRIVSRSGDLIAEGPRYRPDELEEMRARLAH